MIRVYRSDLHRRAVAAYQRAGGGPRPAARRTRCRTYKGARYVVLVGPDRALLAIYRVGRTNLRRVRAPAHDLLEALGC